jgi:hypothetical protein
VVGLQNITNANLLTQLYPELFHATAADSWAGIARHGLLSAAALVEICDADQQHRDALLKGHRRWSESLDLPGTGKAILRDQAPLNLAKLDKCLEDDMTVPQWLTMLNGFVFFWPTLARVASLLKAYADEEHDVIVVDTKLLLSRYPDQVKLSHMNTGTTSPMAFPRGRNTFRQIAAYPLKERSKRKSSAVAEIVIPYAVPDIAEVALRVERWSGDRCGRILWTRGSPLP